MPSTCDSKLKAKAQALWKVEHDGNDIQQRHVENKLLDNKTFKDYFERAIDKRDKKKAENARLMAVLEARRAAKSQPSEPGSK